MRQRLGDPGGLRRDGEAQLSPRPLDGPAERLEVWSEKGTVRGTLAPVLDAYGVTFRVMHGYGSATRSTTWPRRVGTAKPLIALYVGDWDPSGLHMSEVDLPARLGAVWRRSRSTGWRSPRAHVEAGDLPWFSAEREAPAMPATAGIVTHFGRQCWELDALIPVILRREWSRPFAFGSTGRVGARRARGAGRTGVARRHSRHVAGYFEASPEIPADRRRMTPTRC